MSLEAKIVVLGTQGALLLSVFCSSVSSAPQALKALARAPSLPSPQKYAALEAAAAAPGGGGGSRSRTRRRRTSRALATQARLGVATPRFWWVWGGGEMGGVCLLGGVVCVWGGVFVQAGDVDNGGSVCEVDLAGRLQSAKCGCLEWLLLGAAMPRRVRGTPIDVSLQASAVSYRGT